MHRPFVLRFSKETAGLLRTGLSKHSKEYWPESNSPTFAFLFRLKTLGSLPPFRDVIGNPRQAIDRSGLVSDREGAIANPAD